METETDKSTPEIEAAIYRGEVRLVGRKLLVVNRPIPPAPEAEQG